MLLVAIIKVMNHHQLDTDIKSLNTVMLPALNGRIILRYCTYQKYLLEMRSLAREGKHPRQFHLIT